MNMATGDMLKDVVGALRAADVVDGIEGLMQYLDDYAASGKDVAALLSWGDWELPCALTRRRFLDGVAHFTEFKRRGWLSDRMTRAGFRYAVHRCRNDLARDLFALFGEPVNPDDFAPHMAFFNTSHDLNDFEGRIDLGLELGLFDFAGEVADEPSLAVRCLVLNLGYCKEATARLRLLIAKGLPADILKSLPLRWSAFLNDDVDSAASLVERGARVDAHGFATIRFAIQEKNFFTAAYLMGIAGVDVDDLKALFAGQLDESDWDAFESCALDLKAA